MYKFIVWVMLAASFLCDKAIAYHTNAFNYPFYAGIMGGYGKTTWKGLVPPKSQSSTAMMFSTPIKVNEGGGIWGIFVGYEPIPYFGIEASYNRYPNAKVEFDPTSLFVFKHDGHTDLNTHTETVALMAKIMMFIPCTDIRIFSSVGPSGTHRYDQVYDYWRLTPRFGAGINYNFTDHLMAELGANYTAGFGQSELDPAEHYMPFLYSAYLQFAARF